jgi:outer membrane receptor protein involved in Fe transport
MPALKPIVRHMLLAFGGVSAVIAAAPVLAQQPTAEVRREAPVEIVGTRIKRVEAETSQPIFTLTREEIQAQGLTSIGDVIQNLTTNGSTLNTTFNNGGNGETRVSLRNLGSNRTLVLVNGRRWVGGTGLGGAVDLNTIPTAAVDRIEVLKDGASAIYGSDAIAGVVNVILRKEFDGSEANAYIGQYEQGDGRRQSVDLTIGSSGQRFRSLLGVGYVKEEPVMAGDREISAVPVFGTGLAFGSSTGPGGRFAVCNGTFNPTTGTCSGTQTRPDGTPGQFTYNPGQTGTNWRPWTFPADMYNYAPDNYLVTPQERVSLFGRAAFELTSNLEAVLQATFNNRKSNQLLAPMPIVLGTGPGAGAIARTLSISPNSLYNPFGLTVSRVQRRAKETGGRVFEQDVDTAALGLALEGKFDLAGRSLSWDAGFTRARNSQTDTTQGLFNLLALRDALGPSMLDGSGKPVCVRTPGNLATQIPGCVPMNLLGGLGSITPEMLNFSSFVAHDTLGYSMKQLFANITGEIIKLPAGMLAFAAGVERREESGFDSPDPLIASGNTTGNARTPTRGRYEVDEAYLELAVPVLKDLPFAKSLDLTLATRTSDYSNFGGTTNSKAGVRWQVNPSLLIRANWGQGFRAPSIEELFRGLADDFPQVSDPCSTTFGGTYNSLTPAQQARCHAQGVPIGGYDQGNSQIRISVGGNPNLMPEKSETTTIGFVWSPDFVQGLDLSLDWWKIDLKDGITTITAQTILDRCIRDGLANYCALFSRVPGGQIASLLSAGLNVATTEVKGYDLTVNYRLPRTRFGNFSFVWDTTYTSAYIDSEGENLVGQYFDRDNYWRVRSNLAARWEMGSYGATWGVRYYSKQVEDCAPMVSAGFGNLCSDPANGKNLLRARNYHDVTFSWKAPWKGTVTVGINNIFATNPPVSFSTFANSFDPQYEIPGRFLYLRYTQRW